MDLMYLPDSIVYPSMRSSNYFQHEDEPLWINSAVSGPGRAHNPNHQQPLKQQSKNVNQNNNKKEGGPCPLCQERQRRRLLGYIRNKSRQDSECTIEEEEEEVVKS